MLKELSMDYRKIIKEIGRGKNHARDLIPGYRARFVCYPNAEWRRPRPRNVAVY